MIRVISDHTDPDPDHLKGTHPLGAPSWGTLLGQRVEPTQRAKKVVSDSPGASRFCYRASEFCF